MAVQRGTVWFDLDGEGVGTMRFTSTMEYEGDAIRGDGTGQVRTSGISGHVRVYGGTGALAGISGTGTFWSTGPATFGDLVSYVYP